MADATTHQPPRPPEDRDLMLWRMKQTYREKDEVDRVFLRRLLEERGKHVP